MRYWPTGKNAALRHTYTGFKRVNGLVSQRAIHITFPATAVMRRSSRLNGKTEKGSPVLMPPPPAPKVVKKRKASPDLNPQGPITPIKRRAQPSRDPPPLTPTPSRVKLIAEPAEGPKKPPHNAVNRVADTASTNATLLSPETSRVVASRKADSVSPSKLPQKTRTTTANLLEEACAHLIKVDERLRPLIEKHHCRVFSPEGLAEEIDPFESLVSSIISQQVSGAAAKSIKAKFVALFEIEPGHRFPRPSDVANCSIERLRTAGLSQRKAEYVQGLAEKFTNGELSAQLLHDAPYEEVFERLIAVRGLGKWSVEMFACFALKFPDVFSTGDLGVARGMAALIGRDVNKLKAKGGKWKYMSEKEMEEMAEPMRPFRSIFMWYMWRVEETDISTLE